MRKKIHFARMDDEHYFTPLCNTKRWNKVSDTIKDVTCKACLRKIRKKGLSDV